MISSRISEVLMFHTWMESCLTGPINGAIYDEFGLQEENLWAIKV
jgi:hypothetical protein